MTLEQITATQGIMAAMKADLVAFNSGDLERDQLARNLMEQSNLMRSIREGSKDAVKVGLWRAFCNQKIDRAEYNRHRAAIDKVYSRLRGQ